jgi:Tol biopolymer transport system component
LSVERSALNVESFAPRGAVFLSYASQDADAARRIAQALRAEGIEVWFDESALAGGEAWDAIIRRQIRDCALFVAIVSANTQARKEGYFRLEWKLADERSQLIAEGTPFVLPVIVDGTKERDALVPKSFLGVQWTWLPHGEVPPAFVTRVQRLLGEPAGPATPPPADPKPIQPIVTHSLAAANTRGGRRSHIRHSWAVTLPWALCVVLLIGVAWVGLRVPRPSPTLPVRSSIDLLEKTQLTRSTTGFHLGPHVLNIAISPDGGLIALCASPDGSLAKSLLYLRPIGSFDADPIPGSERAQSPFFSPDGKWLGFRVGNQLKKWSIANRGIPTPIATLPRVPVGIAWRADGTIVVGQGPVGLHQIDSNGRITRLTEVRPAEEAAHVLPSFAAGGKAVLFTVMQHSFGTKSRIDSLSLETNERKSVLKSGADARLVAPGHLVFMDHGALMAVPFDERVLATTGTAVPLVQGVHQSLNGISSAQNSGVGQFSVSGTGTLAYASGGILPDLGTRVEWIDHDGRNESIAQLDSKPIVSVRLSPDGRKLAYRTFGKTADVWVFDLVLGTSVRLTREGRAVHLAWTNDGQCLTFGYSRAGKTQIFWKPADGSGPPEPELLVASDHEIFPSEWSLDDKLLLFVESNPDSREDIWIYRRDGKQKSPLFKQAYSESYPTISRDGRWLAYCSNETGRMEVYVTSMETPAKGTPITTDGGLAPVWAPDGRSVYYWRPGWTDFEQVEVAVGSRIIPSNRRKLFTHATGEVAWTRSYDLSPDGRRFLIVSESEKPVIEITRLNLVQNWFEELRRVMPNSR